jgi:hypothetical protein
MRRTWSRILTRTISIGLASIALLPTLSGAGYAETDDGSGTHTTSIFGVSMVPQTQWRVAENLNATDLHYDFDSTALTTYEGALATKWGVKFGASADTDKNVVGKVNRVAGYLGYDNLTLRVQTARLEGTVTWGPPALPGLPTQVHFNDRFQNVDLLYIFPVGVYIGAGYTSFSLPMQFNDGLVTGDNNVGVTPINQDGTVYDPNVTVKYYALLLGVDTMASPLFANDGLNRAMSGWGPMFETQDRIGYGTLTFSPQFVASENTIASRWTPATWGGAIPTLGSSMSGGIIDYEISLGLKYSRMIGSADLAVGAGYYFGGSYFNFQSGDRLDTSFYFTRYGPILRAYARW